MNILAAVFNRSAAVLPHVTWPVAPHDDESLAGFTARTCAYNGLWNPLVLVADAGFRLSKGFGRLARTSHDLSALAALLAVDPSWVEDHRHRSMEESNGRSRWVDFHGARLRSAHLCYSSPRIAPGAVLRQKYHREMWHIVTLAACAKTGELLVEKCQQPGCGKSLAWAGPRGIGHCADSKCGGTLSSLISETVAEGDRVGLTLAASLIDPASEITDTALASLPTCLRKENRGDLFELAWLLGCIDHPDGQKGIASPVDILPADRCQMLARGAARLLSWPSCLTTVLQKNSEETEAAMMVKRVVDTIRAIVRKQTTFGRPATLFAAELEGISTSAFSTVVGRQLGLLTATEFARTAGVKTSKMALLQRSTHISRMLFSEGGRDIALFSPADASDVRHRIQERISAQTFGMMTGLGIDAVELLVAEEVLEEADDPIIQMLWPESHLNRASAAQLSNQIMHQIKLDAAPSGSVKLSAALQGCPAGDKPWPAIVQALLAGKLSFFQTKHSKMNVRSCLISSPDVRKLHSLRILGACCNARSEWLSEADAKERLSISSNCLRSLANAGRLSKSGNLSRLTYRRFEVDAIAVDWVSKSELQAKLAQSRAELSSTLSAVGLLADGHGFLRRSVAREKLGLPTV